jgi:ABC-type Na+ efflux pump permease subunit
MSTTDPPPSTTTQTTKKKSTTDLPPNTTTQKTKKMIVFGNGSVVPIFLVFYVVVFGGVRGAHLFSFLCCSIWWRDPPPNTTTQKTKKISTTDPPPNTTTQKTKKMSTKDPPPNTTVLIFLVFCFVVFGGVRGAHLFSFLCCSIWWGPLRSSF